MAKRVFMIVLDSVGIGEMPDAALYGDEGSNTIRSCSKDSNFYLPNAEAYGLFELEGIDDLKGINLPKDLDVKSLAKKPSFVARMAEASKGKDTTTGHWEMAGLISKEPMPTFPDGFPAELLDEFSKRTGRAVLCNKPYSGTDVIRDYGREACETGALIVYTSADSVFQIAAHEAVVPVEELYRYCEIARELCTGKFGVGRVIARPFEGEWPYKRTVRRHDFSLVPPKKTILNYISEAGKDVLAVGKINDIFAGSGVTKMVRTENNADGIEKTLDWMDLDFDGFCFVNLVDTDMIYGHRNDVPGYAKAISYFDSKLPEIVAKLRKDDLLLITADHGCDPGTPSTDHSREYVGVMGIGDCLKPGVNLGTRSTFADTGATILEYLGVPGKVEGVSYLGEILK
jgi:phosphopentomutase